MMIKKCVCILYLFCVSLAVFSQALFNENVTAEEMQKLADGQILIRNIGKAKKIGLNPVTKEVDSLLNQIKKLKPAYLVEIIQIRPVKGNENLIEKIKPLLLDVQGYADIPYWSEQWQSFSPLYSNVKIVKNTLSQNEGSLNVDLSVDLSMVPFGEFNVDIDMCDRGTELLYRMKNTGNLKYDNITVVRPERMQSIVYVFYYQDNIVLYGIGGLNAPKIFFLRDRLEAAFVNRIKTFCSYIFEKLES